MDCQSPDTSPLLAASILIGSAFIGSRITLFTMLRRLLAA